MVFRPPSILTIFGRAVPSIVGLQPKPGSGLVVTRIGSAGGDATVNGPPKLMVTPGLTQLPRPSTTFASTRAWRSVPVFAPGAGLMPALSPGSVTTKAAPTPGIN